jgi:hypothetical protein
MIVRPPPFQIGEQLWGLLSSGPSPACQRSYCVSDGQIHAFDESGVQPPREA